MSATNTADVIDDELLEILRCPLARQTAADGEDAGKLRIAHGCWLVCDENGMKYPVRDGFPVMLIDEGKKWKDTAVDKLPVPPPSS